MKVLGLELPPIVAQALHECRAHFMAAAGFSLLINMLYLAPTLYMLQVYDASFRPAARRPCSSSPWRSRSR